MRRFSLAELAPRCQKPDYRRVGNWMARRISRPLALRITWVIHPWGISAHAMTLAAWSVGIAAAACFAWGSAAGWIAGALLLQLWYLLDHVDGQLARFHRAASLDGTQLDYLMHHTINLLVPLGIGGGLFVATLEPLWCLAGLMWGVSLLLIGLAHDARYKAFMQRLKRVEGELRAIGGTVRPCAAAPLPRSMLRFAAWLARKLCEVHVTMNLLSLLAAAWLIQPRAGLLATQAYVAVMALLSLAVMAASLARSQREQAAEVEFAAWFRVPPGCTLEFVDGWWRVQPSDSD